MKQLAYLPALDWLVDDSPETCGSGRTYLLAYAFLRRAHNNLDKEVLIFDHFPDYRNIDFIARNIFHIYNEEYKDKYNIYYSQVYKTIIMKEKKSEKQN